MKFKSQGKRPISNTDQKKTRETYEQYKTIRNETNAAVRKKKTEHWEKFPKDMEHGFYGLRKRSVE